MIRAERLGREFVSAQRFNVSNCIPFFLNNKAVLLNCPRVENSVLQHRSCEAQVFKACRNAMG